MRVLAPAGALGTFSMLEGRGRKIQACVGISMCTCLPPPAPSLMSGVLRLQSVSLGVAQCGKAAPGATGKRCLPVAPAKRWRLPLTAFGLFRTYVALVATSTFCQQLKATYLHSTHLRQRFDLCGSGCAKNLATRQLRTVISVGSYELR